MMQNESYLGNPNVKRDGIVQQWTPGEIQEYARCMNDPAYFAKKYCKIISLDEGLVDFDLYPYQEKMFAAFNSNRFNIVLACRQSGKSISSVAYLLWFAIFHSEKIVAVMANKGATAREMLGRVTLMLENLPFFLQPGCKALNKGSIEFSNNSRIVAAATSGSSIRGMSVSLLYLDEFAFVERANEFYTSTYPVVSSGKDTKVIITSTANGIGNVFHKIWEGATQGVNEYKPFRVDWWDVPGRDEVWKNQTIANTSQLQFDQEFGNCLKTYSEITILIKNIVYDIRIGDLYDCIQRGSSSGLSTEEGIRLAAIRWYNYEKKNESTTINMQILTPSGFQPFEGVARYWHNKSLKFVFDDGNVESACDHVFIVNGKEIFAHDIKIGDNIGKIVKNIIEISEGDYFYDPVNVSNGKIYNHDNGLVSHNTFFGTGDTLVGAETLLSLRRKNPVEITREGTKIYETPKKDHQYIMTVDVAKGRGQDYSTFNLLDVTANPFRQVAVYRNNTISPLLFPNIIYKFATSYNEAMVVIESNDAGQVVCNGLYHELEYENMFVESTVKANALGVLMTRKVKRIGCSSFKDLIENKKIEVVDEDTILEISTFVAKGTSYEASEGNHDDLVMNLIMFGYFVGTTYFNELTDINIKQMMFEQRMKEIEDDVLPFGFVDDGLSDIPTHDPEREGWAVEYSHENF